MRFTHIDVNLDITYDGHLKTLKNVHRMSVLGNFDDTFISDVSICDINMCEPHYVHLFFFVNLLHQSKCLTIWHFTSFQSWHI